MKPYTLLLTLLIGFATKGFAQQYEAAVSGGTSLFRQLHGQAEPIDHIRSWDVEASIRKYSKRGRWSYGLTLNRSEYRFVEYYEMRYWTVNNLYQPTSARQRTSVQDYTIRVSADYDVLHACAQHHPALKKWQLTIGGTMAPVLSRQTQRVSYPDAPELGTDRYAANYFLGFQIGMQERLSYHINPKLSATLSSGTVIEPGKMLSNWPTYGFDPDFRCSAMIGLAYNL